MIPRVAALEGFDLETFSRRLGAQFTVELEEGPTVELVLTEAAEPEFADSERAPGHRRAFSVVFLGPREPILPQRTYSFSHDELGDFELFIVPIAQDDLGTQYEAVFG